MSRRPRAAAGLTGALLALSACGGDSAAEGRQDGGNGSGGDGAAASGTVTCAWGEGSSANPYLTEVAPPEDVVPAAGTTDLRVATNLGELTVTLDRAATPCAAASLVHLSEQDFFDDTACHREVDSEGLQVLQCGDPTGTGAGGPTYTSPTEVTGEETYPRGTVAMANSGQGFDGSQFFLVWGDSRLPPAYTVVGTVDEAGLAVLDQVAVNGNDGSLEPSPGGGAPNVPVTIESVTVA
ncbi:peptidyl-prolyl cis-trans isomerase B (cyclophilin B) [Geodermatophilus obscurus]|uniref:Peptidyl-prolyl cis-trans isomerase B (Cyclophilin B) n=1 Tax=Geodermatophilus obscurus TaxID=1861 RepID=A0A1M7TQX7_9ACTN|nr:peptidylprolyl isomerase [Geodermatophilus obscurus]SHN73151.1 peptidyl-prolyl cis-trans isomerase B (cyclophilin B) [Geodermatophilus obscurus]